LVSSICCRRFGNAPGFVVKIMASGKKMVEKINNYLHEV
jgi:hypothetical protein